MNVRSTFVVLTTVAAALGVLPGCAVTRSQETVGAYIDDATITASVKAKFAENKRVDATSIRVETLNGEVLLSGFDKDLDEKDTAENLARSTKGVKAVKNQIVVRA